MLAKSIDLLNQVRKNITVSPELDYFLIHHNRYQFILDKILQLGLPEKSKILDVGCFPLHLYTALELAGFSVFGISSHHEPVKGKNIVVANIETDKLPFPEVTFDLVLFSEVMEHLLYNPKTYLGKFKSLLKPHGYFFLTTPNAVHLKHRMQSLGGINPSFPLFQLEESSPENRNIYHRHNREYTLREVQAILDQSGFKISQSGYFNAYSPWREKLHPDSLKVKIIKGAAIAATHLSGSLKDTLYIIGRKDD